MYKVLTKKHFMKINILQYSLSCNKPKHFSSMFYSKALCNPTGPVFITQSNRLLSTEKLSVIRNTTRRRKKKKMYSELMEVNESSSNLRKAPVQKLGVKYMEMLANRPEVTLEDLHTLKKKTELDMQVNKNLTEEDHIKLLKRVNLKRLNNNELEAQIREEVESELIQRNIKNIEVLSTECEIDELENEVNEIVEESASSSKKKRKEAKKPKIKSQSKNSVHIKSKMRDIDFQNLKRIVSQNLSSFIDVCVGCGFLNRALFSLASYCNSLNDNRVVCLDDPHPFNLLMHGFAAKENLGRVKQVLKMLEKTSIKPSPQSFAACFECLGRMSEIPTDELLLFRTKLEESGYILNDLFDKCTYNGDQCKHVMKSVLKLDKNFVAKITMPDLSYNLGLVNSLNQHPGTFKSPAEGLITKDEMKELIKEQLKSEHESFVSIRSIAKPTQLTEELIYYRNKWQELENSWRMSTRESLARELAAMRTQHTHMKSYRCVNIYPYLRILTSEQYVDIIIREVRKLAEGSETYSPTVKQLHRELGNQVRIRSLVKQKCNTGVMNKMEKLYGEYCNWYLDPTSCKESVNTRQRWQRLLHSNHLKGPSLEKFLKDVEYRWDEQNTLLNARENTWPNIVVTEVGKFLYNIIIKDIRIDANAMNINSPSQALLPAFYTLYRVHGLLLKEEIKPHPVLLRLHRSTLPEFINMDISLLPMSSPPLPWTNIANGGYIIAKADLIRLKHHMASAQQWHLLQETPSQQMYPSLDSLNQLSSIPWTVNEPILDVVLEVFQNGGSINLNVPRPPSACDMPELDPSIDRTERIKVYKQRLSILRKRAEMYGLWCEALYRLSLANHYRNKIFWLPHNMDFRGRVYPVPPHLNHLGSDMARSLLRFAKGEPLGPKGFDWLKIHCINLTGTKKRNSISDRLAYANEILPDIIDSAERPLTGKMWWSQAEDRWQTLAVCMEIKKIIDSGDYENYVSHIPVHQDGSCNGLQHYAALGRDYEGAVSVNLTKSDAPQDVYSHVVALVEKQRQIDADNEIPIAKSLEGFVTRKVIKQTVMTTVYGVTRFGARLQIAKQLKNIDSYPQELVWGGSAYLVSKTFDALGAVFSSSREIQDWFTECAKVVAKCYGQNVEWITPLGLPVVQPYTKRNNNILKISKDGTISDRFCISSLERPNTSKQKNAFPPNFIHSLDSTHMMLTSLSSERKGITFVSVHDCYWTHPSTVDIMNLICRQQFVALHSEPILEDLSSFFVNKYVNVENDVTKNKPNELEIFKKLPKKGDYNLEEVLQSDYFFS